MDANRLRQLFADGHHAEAESAAVALVDSGDRSATTLAVLAAAARELGHFDTAASALREAAARSPDDPVAWLALARVLTFGGRWNEALRAFRWAAELAPRDPQPLFDLGRAQLMSQRSQDAERTVARLLERFPDVPESHVLHAHLERTLGRTQPAIAAYRNALELDDRCAPALLGLAELDIQSSSAHLVERVACALASGNRTVEQRVQLEYAMARLLDREAKIDEAFAHFTAANELQRNALATEGIHCHREQMKNWVRTARERYPRSGEAVHRSGSPDDGIAPIFIIGMPRSGTTLIEQILSRHPEVSAGGEFTAAAVIHADYIRARSQAGLTWPADPARETEHRLLADARERYVEQALALAGDSLYFVDKHPGNATLVGFLRMLFPAAPVIHASRAPLAACWSMYATYLPGSSACFTALDDIAHYHAAHVALMGHWTSTCTPPIFGLAYEQLVSEPERVIRLLLSACGLAWAEECLAPQAGQSAVTTASVDQVRNPIHRGSIDRHRRYQSHLEPLQAALESAARAMSFAS
jgi:tetratricopeptide (TPR) repeat protein